MRIIAGEFRGRTLLPPEGDATRPITDRVKQSLFDILTPLVPDAIVYDLFAGTGSMGLESLSRGAKLAVFFESDRSAVARLQRNIDALGVRDRSRIVPTDLFRHFSAPIENRKSRIEDPIDLLFLDPPYRYLREKPDALRSVAASLIAHLAPEATVIFRHDAAHALALPPLEQYDVRTYGSMTVELLRAYAPSRLEYLPQS